MRPSISPGKHLTIAEGNEEDEEQNELPLLEELEIYPERIIQKSILILNPIHSAYTDSDCLLESDLAGPILFCIIFGVFSFLSGANEFSYIYGMSMVSVFGMYALLKIMSNTRMDFLTLARVASALGYGILPIVSLSFFNMFISLNGVIGLMIFVLPAIILSTIGSTKILCFYTQCPEQKLLIGYPCALIYIAFTIVALF